MKTKELSLHHIIKESSLKNQKVPALFMFHGYGSNEQDLFSFASELPQEFTIISVRAPYSMGGFANAWYAINFDSVQGKFSDNVQAVNSRDKIIKFIEEAISDYEIDMKKITLLGFSQGTILSYAVALSRPELIKNLVALSGYLNLDLLPENYAENDFSNLDIYASHGSVDQVIPVSWARKAPIKLKELGIKHQFSEFPVGHGVAPENLNEIIKWLKQKV